jgi:hypothetical protein
VVEKARGKRHSICEQKHIARQVHKASKSTRPVSSKLAERRSRIWSSITPALPAASQRTVQMLLQRLLATTRTVLVVQSPAQLEDDGSCCRVAIPSREQRGFRRWLSAAIVARVGSLNASATASVTRLCKTGLVGGVIQVSSNGSSLKVAPDSTRQAANRDRSYTVGYQVDEIRAAIATFKAIPVSGRN